MNFIRTSLLGLAAAASLAAQSTGFSAGGGLILAPSEKFFGAYDKAVNNNLGYYVTAGYDFKIYQTDVDSRASLTVGFMPGKETEFGLKTDLTLFQLSDDIFLPLGSESLRGLFGFSANFYSASFSGTESTDRNDVNHHFPFKDADGLKLGFRLGLDYAFTKNLSAELLFQQTELAGSDISELDSPTQQAYVRRGGINPSWLQLGVRYSF